MSLKIIFSSEDDKILSELVGCHPCLYDLKHKSYKDHTIRENVWKQISDELNRPVNECKKRWKNIKDTYNRKRRGRKLGTGSATREKPSKWILEDVLSFMDIATYERESITNATSIEENTNDDDNGNSNSNDNSVSIQIDPEMNDLPLETTFEPAVTERTSEIESTYNKKRQKKTEAFIEILNKRSEERNRLFKELTKTEEEDPIDLFFKSMAHTVKKFSPDLKIKAKMDVLKIINDLELQNLKPSEQTSGPSDYVFPENLTFRPQALNYSSTTHNTSDTHRYTSMDDLNSSEPNWAGPFQNY